MLNKKDMSELSYFPIRNLRISPIRQKSPANFRWGQLDLVRRMLQPHNGDAAKKMQALGNKRETK
tara:strand:+ start:392 stop:586 length:195 start_codon:yes stop_codon:yes gene_type:complete